MISTGKTFTRRPWDAFSHGLIQHFDGINIVDPGAGNRGLYLCLHSSKQLLDSESITGAKPDGFWWEALVLENFSVTGTKNVEGIYISDAFGKPDITLKNGTISGIDSTAVRFSNLGLGTIRIRNVKANGPISLDSCLVESLIVEDCQDLNFIGNCTVNSIELHNCKNVDVQALTTVPKIINDLKPDTLAVASLAINIKVGGVTYGLDVASSKLIPR